MNFIAKRIHWIGLLVLAGFTALAAGLYFDNPAPKPRAKTETAAAAKYVCPMHPDVARTGPAQCPECGMALVPASSVPAAPAAAAGGCGMGEGHDCCNKADSAPLDLPPGHPPIPHAMMHPGCTMTPSVNPTNPGSL